MVNSEGKIYLIDFEQACRKGDRSWDIAVFLYYAGHYLPVRSEGKAEKIAKAFIAGYLKADGDPDAVRTAGINKYTRIFSVFTLPSILRVISIACKNAKYEYYWWNTS